jgi:2-oxoisovalerate dehydrogenase E2 component (dihydrolipoyl transacylase)
MPDFLLPDLGEGLTEAEITSWLVQVGDHVEIDQIVVEVETAKAAVEVPIPFAGTVSALHGAAGQSIAVGTTLISVEAVVAETGSGNVLIGYGTPAAGPRRRRGSRRPVAPAPAAASVAVISPIVRKLARDAGVNLHAVNGSGPSGLVLRRDVESAIADVGSPPSAADPDVQRIPITGLRKVVADKLSRSRREIPEATVWVDVDATGLLAARAELNRRDPQQPVGVLALLARFVILGLRRYPELNGRVEGDEIVLAKAVHLGFAAQTDRGLMVPVVHDADRLTTRQLSQAMGQRTTAARAGTLRPAELTGGTFTVNNYGVFGVDGSAAIINHPEVAILGIGRIIDKPWVHEGALAIRKVTQLTLAFDHRVCDGGTAGGFLRLVADCVESPVSALGEL